METALACVLGLAREMLGPEALYKLLAKSLNITILGDNDFYSQRLKVSFDPISVLFHLRGLSNASSSELSI